MGKKEAKMALPVAPLPDLVGWWESQHVAEILVIDPQTGRTALARRFVEDD